MSKTNRIVYILTFLTVCCLISLPAAATNEAVSEPAYAFEMKNGNGVLIDTTGTPLQDGGDGTPFKSIENFTSVANAAPSGSTIKLNTDVHLTVKSQNITLKQGASLNIDLNGHTLSYVMAFGSSKRGNLFVTATNSSLNIYSSRSGGMIMSSGALDSGAVGNNAMIKAYSYGFSLSLGAYKNDALGIDATGDNLTVVAASIIDFTSSSSTSSTININGGSYIKYGTASPTAFLTLRGSVNLSANNALFYSLTDNYIFSDEAQSYAKMNIEIDGCVIIQTVGTSPFVNKLTANSSVTVTNSNIIAPLLAGHKGTVKFGDGTSICTQITGEFDKSLYSYTESAAMTSLDEIPQKLDICFHDITADKASKTVTVTAEPVLHTVNYSLSHRIVSTEKLLTTNTKANLNTKNGFYFNFYLPTDITNSASVFSDRDYSISLDGESKTVYGIDYSVYAISVSPDEIGNVSIYVKLPALNGATIQKEYTLSLSQYFKTVLNSDSVTPAERKLVINAANYSNAVFRYINGTDAEAYSEILTEENLKLTSIDREALKKDAESADINNLYSYINGITVYVGDKNIPRLAFYSASTLPLNITFHSIDSTGSISYTATKYGNYYLASDEYGIYDIIENMDLTIGDAHGSCNLALYIIEASESDKAKAVAEAIYAYATASYEYVTMSD